MKTVIKIDPEKEYKQAKKIIELATKERLNQDLATSLDASVDNLITAARVLMEREELRRGKKKTIPKKNKSKKHTRSEQRKEAKKLPSERFPNLEIKENKIEPDHVPLCPCCNEPMKESGLFDIAEKLEIIPKQYYIVREKRSKYNCSNCHGSMINTPATPSIVPTSNYGDSLILDVSLSKYCDLIPIERYAQIAAREGLVGLPPQSLIGLTHHLANFLDTVYQKIKEEILLDAVVHADETPHKMLEGDKRNNWYLWGFFTQTSCYFEAHNTRSGDIALDFLTKSNARYLLTDGYAGYHKAIHILNDKHGKDLTEVFCNAHAYRYFKDACETWEEDGSPPLRLYGQIYELERERFTNLDNLNIQEQLNIRQKMLPLFEQIKQFCEQNLDGVMPGSSLKKSIQYFLNHYDGLTVCTTNIEVPLDNNLSEREMRSPVIGRKTWFGTHSKRGAKTNATLFSIVHSCKINNINPRNYFPWIVTQLLKGLPAMTPFKYSKIMEIQ